MIDLFPIHLDENIESDQTKVHRAGARIKKRDLTRGLQRTTLGLLHGNQISKRMLQFAIGVHLHPQPTKRVLYKETNNPANREKLCNGGDVFRLELLTLLAGARKGGLKLFGMKRLINPANCFF